MAEQGDNPIRGSGFNTDPQTGDWDQLAFENHSLNERVRGENTDTDDAFAIYVQGVAQTTKVFNVLKTGAIFVGSTNTAVLSATSGITLGAAAAAGSGLAALRYDATIRAFSATNPIPVGSVATYGSISLASREDHAHLGVTSIAASGNAALSGAFRLYAGPGVGLTQIADGVQIMASTAVPAGASAGVPVVILGTTNAAGAIGTFLDVGSRIQIYDGTAPASLTVGGAVVQGGGSFAARSNHGHAISDQNVNIYGGSWGSGPILVAPQVAATGWASANHAHAAANSGGVLAAKTMKYHYAEPGTDISTSSGSFVDATGYVVTFTPTSATNDIVFNFSLATQNNSAARNDFILDIGGTDFFGRSHPAVGEMFMFGQGKKTNIAASSTVVQLQYACTAGTINIFGSGTYDSNVLVEEYS